MKALFEGRTIPGGASRGLPEREAPQADAEGQEGPGHGEVEGGIPVRRYWGERSARLGSHRVEENKGGGLEENLQCYLKCRTTTQHRAGTLMTSELMGEEVTAGSGMPGPGGGKCEGRRKDTQGGVYRCFLICNMGIKGSYLMERCRD